MTYDYNKEKPKLMTPDGVRLLFAIRDQARRLIGLTGAFTEEAGTALPNSFGAADSFQLRAALWFLVESEELKAIPDQHSHVFIPGKEWRL
jgi:hypothetical protein